MKRKFTVNFMRAITKVTGPLEEVEVVLMALRSEMTGVTDATNLPAPERRVVTLTKQKTQVVFEVEPSYQPGFERPIVYRIGWRRGFFGKMEYHTFTMPNKDCNFEDIQGSFVPEGHQLTEEDIGLAGRVPRLNTDGNVENADGETLATLREVGESVEQERSERIDEDIRIVSRVDNGLNDVLARSQSYTRDAFTSYESDMQSRIAEINRNWKEGDNQLRVLIADIVSGGSLEDLLNKKADLIDGKIPSVQLPDEAFSRVVKIVDNGRLTQLEDAVLGTIAVSPTDSWQLTALPPTVASSWTRIAALRSGVQSVNGKTDEAVVLTAADVGARDLTPLTIADIVDVEAYLNGKLTGVVRVESDSKISSTLLRSDIARLDGKKIVNDKGEEVAVAGDVTSVNGLKGDVVVTPALIGARPTGTIPQADVTGLSTALAGKVATNDPRLTNDRKPLQHADSHKENGNDPLVLSQAQITGLVDALGARATKQEFEDFRRLIEAELPENPEQHEWASKEYAAISLQGASTSIDSADKARDYLADIEQWHTQLEDDFAYVQNNVPRIEGMSDDMQNWYNAVQQVSEEVSIALPEIRQILAEVKASKQIVEDAVVIAVTLAQEIAG